MNKEMLPYYLSRAALSVMFGLAFYVGGASIWMALLAGALALGFFLWAPHSGRYAVHPEHGWSALRRDERSQTINDKAGRNAFIVTMIATAALVTAFSASGAGAIPVSLVSKVLIAGALSYFISDLWLRKAQQ